MTEHSIGGKVQTGITPASLSIVAPEKRNWSPKTLFPLKIANGRSGRWFLARDIQAEGIFHIPLLIDWPISNACADATK